MITSLDAWTLRRLLCDKPVLATEAERVSSRFGSIIERLGGLPLEQRQVAYDGFLDGLKDRDEVVRAVDDADPESRPPDPESTDDSDQEDDGWEPIRFASLPLVEPFPLGVLPPAARRLAESAARSIGAPVDFVCMGIIAAASVAIGRSCSLLVKPSYFESASVYAAIIGGASSGKSPSLKAALAPIWVIQERLRAEREVEVQGWESESSVDRRPKPVLRRLATTNPTTEALGPIMAANPRGLIVLPDEFTGWVASMNQYKGGNGGDRPFYLSAWSGESVYIDRAKHSQEPIAVPHPFLSVVGGLVPSSLPSLVKGGTREDGFMARLLIVYPDPKKRVYSEEGISDDDRDDFAALLERLHALAMREFEGKLVPRIVRIVPAAREMRASWHDLHHEEIESPDFPSGLDGAWGKLEGYGYRLALILHLLDLAADPTASIEGGIPELPAMILEKAFRLVGYFKSHARRVHSAFGGKAANGGEDVQALLRWVIRNEKYQFSVRDVGNDFDRFKHDRAVLDDALKWMISRNLIRSRPEPEFDKPRPGRKPSSKYEANPALWKSPHFLQFHQNSLDIGGSEGFEGSEGRSEPRS